MALGFASQAQEGKPLDQAPPAPKPPSAEALAAQERALRIAWEEARRTAHQIAASHAYRQRDAHWGAELPKEGFKIIPLQLYAGNDYFLIIGSDSATQNISASAFGPDRRLIKSAPDRSGGKLVLRIRPEKSGKHYLRLHQSKPSQTPVHCALTYVYR